MLLVSHPNSPPGYLRGISPCNIIVNNLNLSCMNKLLLSATLLKNAGALTFKLTDCKVELSKVKQTAMFMARCSNGKVVEFNENTMNRVVEPTDETETEYRIKPGTQFQEKTYPDGSVSFSLIPADAASGSAFKSAKI